MTSLYQVDRHPLEQEKILVKSVKQSNGQKTTLPRHCDKVGPLHFGGNAFDRLRTIMPIGSRL